MRAIVFLILLLLSPSAGLADPLGAANQTLLDDTRERFIEAMLVGDFETVIGAIPPKLIAHIAESGNVSVAELTAILPRLMKEAMERVSFSNFQMVTENLDATTVVADGEEYIWGFAPSSIDMTVLDQHYTSTGHTLALLDGGAWYLVRAAETDKVEMLRVLYPFLSAVDFPEETLTRTD